MIYQTENVASREYTGQKVDDEHSTIKIAHSEHFIENRKYFHISDKTKLLKDWSLLRCNTMWRKRENPSLLECFQKPLISVFKTQKLVIKD